MTFKNKRFVNFLLTGWRPSYHGEFLDLYNNRAIGGVFAQHCLSAFTLVVCTTFVRNIILTTIKTIYL